MNRSRNLAARAGRWSAQHRRKAVLGWLAFVIAAVMIGGSIGTKTLDGAEEGVGESGRADKAYEKAFPKETADETVLVQTRTATARDPRVPRRGGRRDAAPGGTRSTSSDVEAPYADGDAARSRTTAARRS